MVDYIGELMVRNNMLPNKGWELLRMVNNLIILVNYGLHYGL